jgi:hypothetical protein
MRKLIVFASCCFLLPITACKGKPEETFTDITNGQYKAIIRTQEFHHSGIVNTEVCITHSSDTQFPSSQLQCFLRGYDFSNLSASWKSPTEIVISFRCGRIGRFSNDPILDSDGTLPQGFYVYLNDACTLHDRIGDTKQ